ncbi:MAG: hypothetical protein EOP38_09275 [Rubrivivax sp.]|nr:MAG: hypothetical protein EOP38_09275 [Rubrivivax sp.]
MNAHGPLWQDLVAVALVLLAAGYLGRRWWPSLSTLLGRRQADPPAGQAACGQGGACQNCASPGATPKKDHRIVVVRRRH